jgi:FMN phosphatase YigB (HAD superfamily)
MNINYLLENPIMILGNANTLKEVIKMLDKENLLIEISMQSNKLKKLNNIINNFNFEKIANQEKLINDLYGNSKLKKDIDTLFNKFTYLLAKHLWCLYFTDKTTYDILKKFYLDLYKIDISTFSNGKFTEENIKKYISDDYISIDTTASIDPTIPVVVTIFNKVDTSITSIVDFEFHNKALTNVIIPESVKTIGRYAYMQNQLTNVTIPKLVTTIGEYAFGENQLSSVKIGDKVTSIGNAAFEKNQLTRVEIPESVTSIGKDAFSDNKITNVTIGDKVTSISNGAFHNNQLAKVEIPESVTSIGKDAFSDNKLTNVIIGNNVESIGNNAFSTNKLTDVKIPDSVTSIGSYAYYINELTSVTIGNKVESIGTGAFSRNKLTSIIIPESVTQIDFWALSDNQLTTVTMPSIFNSDEEKKKIFGDNFSNIIFIIHTPKPIDSSVTSILARAYRFKGLRSVKIPDSIIYIGVDAFAKNILTSVTIGKKVKSIGDGSFSNNKLTDVSIPNSVTSIGVAAFMDNELTSVVIPPLVTSISAFAFSQNYLTRLTLGNKVTSIGASAFASNKLTSVEIQDSVTSIGEDAFQSNNLTSLKIPDSVIDIGAFALNKNYLTRLTLGNKVTNIGASAFVSNKLTSVEIPDSVIDIGNGAFSGNELTRVTIGKKVTSIGDNAFEANLLTSVEIPNSVTRIGEDAFLSNFLTTLKISDSVIDIGNGAFGGNALTSVIIGKKVTSIGESAFMSNKLTSVEIPNSVTRIGEDAFRSNKLTSVTIPDSVIDLGGAFADNELRSVKIGKKVTSIGDSAFHTNRLTSVEIPDSVTHISNHAFIDNKLTSVTIGNKVISIGESAFAANKLTSVEIPDSVIDIGDNAFFRDDYNLSNQLTNVTMPARFNSDKERIFGENFRNIIFDIYSQKTAVNPLDSDNFFHDLDYDPDRNSISLQRMMRDMRNRKDNNMLYMPDDENHPVNENKINDWINLQCHTDAQIIAQLFKKHKKYISWKQFYEKSIQVFDMLYNFVGDKSYCIFTKEVMSGINFNDKSTYWMIQLMLDYFIKTKKTNFPKELLLCSKTTCPSSNYDYYIVLDDCIYSGGQVFDDVILINNINANKIIVVAPYISRNALDIYGSSARYKKCFHAEIMENWWKDETVKLSTGTYNLNNKSELASVLKHFDMYFPSPRENSVWTYKNLMYFFDHKIADYASAFPTAYQIGLISPIKQVPGLKQLSKSSSNTYDDSKNPSPNEICLKQTYLPFLENCFNDKPVFYDITEVHKTHPENLCVMPWYKKKYEENQIDKKVFVFDFDNTLVNGDYTDEDVQLLNKPLNEIFVNMSKFKEILDLAWVKLIPIYIVSRRPKNIIVSLLNRFYKEENISIEKQLYSENILGHPSSFMYPSAFVQTEKSINKFWSSRKARYLNYIFNLEKVNRSDVLFCDNTPGNIAKAKKNGFVNSILIDKTKNAVQVIDAINNFISKPSVNLTTSTTRPISKFPILNMPTSKPTTLDISNIDTRQFLLDKDYDPKRQSLSLQRIIRDMRIRKNRNMLYMGKSENFPINTTKLDEWINLQCNDDAKILAGLFKSHTKYISWEQFYKKSKEVFEKLYKFVGDKSSYCIFTSLELAGNVNFNNKSNYWMIQLMLDYFIETNKKNFPKELLLCDKSCPTSNYDYYIVLDDCSYSGSQLFSEQLEVVGNIDPNKIILVAPYISEHAIEKYKLKHGNKYKDHIYATKMEYWWKDVTVTLSSGTYNLNIEGERNNVLKLIGKYFPNDGNFLPTRANSMYYFDHKVADYVSTFPSVYHTGIITPDFTAQTKASNYTYDDALRDSPACVQRSYLPFLDNCANNKPTLNDIEYSNALKKPDKLCVDTWYKRKYDNNQIDKKVLVFDFDDTLVNGKFADGEINTKPLNEIFVNKVEFIEILNIAWKKLMPVYIISRRKKDLIVELLNRFYTAENIPMYLQIYNENILGRPKEFVYPVGFDANEELKKQFWANRKVKYLNHIFDLENIEELDILFCDDLQINIDKAKENGYDNSIVIDENENAKQVLIEVNKFASSIDYKQKYFKYKQKYIKLKSL